jgi:uncharacterized protein with von Willebrand factor type A (vWA) domain
MNNHTLNYPLIHLFIFLRHQGLPLGIDDYLGILKLLETGISVGDIQQVKQICKLLWTKNLEEQKLIDQFCDRLQTIEISYAVEKEEESTPINPSNPVNIKELPSITVEKPSTIPQKVDYFIASDPVQKVQAEVMAKNDIPINLQEEVAQAVKIPESNKPDYTIKSYRLRQDYLPLTQREMKQCWRFLRRPVREGIPVEIDIKSTINKITKEGIFSSIVLQPRRLNATELVILIDSKGSMIPFHPITRQLVYTAIGDGKLKQTNVYYFHNCPEQQESYLLFHRPTLTEPIYFTDIKKILKKRTVVMIISDGGAARGWYDSDRVENTKQFLLTLKGLVSYSVWLNPMPKESWQQTTAQAIEELKLIPMFSLNLRGFKNAIAVLQGRYI